MKTEVKDFVAVRNDSEAKNKVELWVASQNEYDVFHDEDDDIVFVPQDMWTKINSIVTYDQHAYVNPTLIFQVNPDQDEQFALGETINAVVLTTDGKYHLYPKGLKCSSVTELENGNLYAFKSMKKDQSEIVRFG